MQKFVIWHTRHYSLEVEAKTEAEAVKLAEDKLTDKPIEDPPEEDGWEFDGSTTQA